MNVFRDPLQGIVMELMIDGDDQVAIEGVNILSVYHFLFERTQYEN